MKRKQLAFYMGILIAALLTACANEAPPVNESESIPTEQESNQPEPALPANVNEAGRVPVLMYHRIAVSESDYDRTPDDFRKDLERLYEEGYRPISLSDFVEGKIEVPAGLSPVIITFDDGDKSQYEALEQGVEPTEGCAVGIMEAFREAHPDFNPQATFFVNGGVPFGQKAKLQEKITYLVSRGYTIGNHTWGHEKLSTLTPDQIAEALGKNAAALEELAGRTVNLLALPYGIRPKDETAMSAVLAGSFGGKAYSNAGICNVGWQPELPAYVKGFDPAAINRIRCGDDADETGDWLKRLSEKPENRYFSDGDPNTVTVPAAMADSINEGALGSKTLRVIE